MTIITMLMMVTVIAMIAMIRFNTQKRIRETLIAATVLVVLVATQMLIVFIPLGVSKKNYIPVGKDEISYIANGKVYDHLVITRVIKSTPDFWHPIPDTKTIIVEERK